MKIKIFIICLVLICQNSCKYVAYKKYVRNFSISFGSSGGFTGTTIEYILNEEGSLYHIREFSKDTILLKTIEKKKLKHIFKLTDSKNIKNIELHTVGNMTRFINLFKDGQIVKTWQWADGNEIPKELKQLYSQLYKLPLI